MIQKAHFISGLVAMVVFLATAGMQIAHAEVPSCSAQPIPNFDQCCTPAEVLYLLDWSKSITDNPADKTDVLDFLKRSRCMFHETATKSGLIVFNKNVSVAIPFAYRNSSEWYEKVDELDLVEQQKYTPMAEALWKAGQVFNESGKPPCGVNRLVILLSDGRPYQNMPANPSASPPYPQPYAGTDIPTDWLYRPTNQGGPNSAYYAERIVPAQAKSLKDNYDARIIVLALKSGTGLLDNARVDYFKGDISNVFKCETTTANCRNGNTCTTGQCNGIPKASSQCYLQRLTVREISKIIHSQIRN